MHGWHDVRGPARARGRALGDVQVVDVAVRVERLAQRDGVALTGGVVGVLVGRKAYAHHEVGSDCLAHGPGRLAQHAHPILEAPAVAVLAHIEIRIEELRGEVAVTRDDLHTVEARGLQPYRALGVAGDDLLQKFDANGLRHDVEALVRHRGRCERDG